MSAWDTLVRLPVLRRLLPSIRRRAARLAAVNGFSLRRSRGAALLLNTDNYVDRQIAFSGDYERAQQDSLLAAMRAEGCDVFVDVGANIGLYTVRVGMAGLARRILAFEPDARNRCQLSANLLLNGLAEWVEIRAEAVSDQAGEVAFAPAEANSTGRSRVMEAGALRVAATTLDAELPGRDLRVFVKMDIEGHEIAACRGMAGVAARHRLFLQVESFAGNLPALTALLAGMGLRPVQRIGDDHCFANFRTAVAAKQI